MYSAKKMSLKVMRSSTSGISAKANQTSSNILCETHLLLQLVLAISTDEVTIDTIKDSPSRWIRIHADLEIYQNN